MRSPASNLSRAWAWSCSERPERTVGCAGNDAGQEGARGPRGPARLRAREIHMAEYELATEVFALPYLGQRIVYAPLLDTSLLVNESCLSLLQRIRAGDNIDDPVGSGAALATLLDLGLVLLVDGSRTAKGNEPPGGAAPQARDGDKDQDGVAEPYTPTACTLFLTTACNLRCRYCYASGGDHPRLMDETVAAAAIDLVVRNAAAAGASQVPIGFHGGGEPTLAAELLERCVSRARDHCDRAGLSLSAALATNGVMSDQTRDFIAENMDSVMLSMDGLPAVQDRLRPRADGRPSFEAVERTLTSLDGGSCRVGVRMTTTDDSLSGLVGGVRYLVQNYHPDVIQIEPVFVCGRSLRGGLRPPHPDDFVEVFRTCRALAACHGVPVVYSGARTGGASLAFCQACAPSFNVTTEGDVTSCYEVVDRSDPRAQTFIFGAYEGSSGSFRFDEPRIRELRRLTVDNAPRCSRCFAKYNCAADCPAKRLYPGSTQAATYRCLINRQLTQDQLEEGLLGATETISLLAHQHGEDGRGIVDGPAALETEGTQ